MLQLLKAFGRSEKAAVLPMFALLVPVLVGMVGVGVDISGWMMSQRKLQIAYSPLTTIIPRFSGLNFTAKTRISYP